MNIPDDYPIVWDLRYTAKSYHRNSHGYILEIPKKVKHYEIDGYTSVNGAYHEKQTIFRQQDVPTPDEIKNDFNRYFEQYSFEENGVVESCVDMFNIRISEGGDLQAFINVIYYKNHIPYPYKNATMNIDYFKDMLLEKDKEINELLELNDEIKEISRREKRNFAILNSIYKKQISQMEKKMRDLYKQTGESEECPVCYVGMDSENLSITNCCHFICNDCYKKCDNCPMCREVYMKKPV